MNELKIGLEGVAITETEISNVRGVKGELVFRGHWAQELALNYTYEEVAYLLWNGQLPNAEELKAFVADLAARRALPDYLKAIIQQIPRDMTVMEVMRTAISAIKLPGESYPPEREQAMEILAKAPTIATYFQNLLEGKPEVEPDPSLDHASDYLYMLHNRKPTETERMALTAYMILSADHGMNASTFTARVVTSTQADMGSAVTAAIGALIGPLHGGAPSKVDDMLDEIGTEENAEPWLREKLENDERLMGFGHRVYKTYDPRAAALREVAKKFAEDSHLFKLSLAVEKVAVKLLKEYKPGRNLYPNIEFWAAGTLRTINLPRSLYTPTFCMARIAGWTANIFEQAANNRLIRPSAIYVGPEPEGKQPNMVEDE